MMKYLFTLFAALFLFPCFARAEIKDFDIFSLDIPNGYITEEVDIDSKDGIALIVQNQENSASVTIIYDSLHENTFAEVLEKYENSFKPFAKIKNEEINGEAYILDFIYEEKNAKAFIFNENTAYTLYVFHGEDENINKAVNSLKWK